MCLHLCEPQFLPFYTSEWPFDQKFCYFPKEDFFLGHPVYLLQCSAVYTNTQLYYTDSPSFTACCRAISPKDDTLLTFFAGNESVKG